LSIPAQEKIAIFYGAVDRAGYLRSLKTSNNRSPLAEYRAAFAECLQRVDVAARIFAAGERVLWIAHQSDREREPATRTDQFWHKVFTEVELGTSRLTGKKSSIADTVYFGNARNSIALQLADICCSTITLYLLEKFYKWTPIVGPFYELIRPAVMVGDVAPMFLS